MINPDPLLSVAQHIKDLKNKKITKSRKKRKQNTEDEGREKHREPREVCTDFRQVALLSSAENQTFL